MKILKEIKGLTIVIAALTAVNLIESAAFDKRLREHANRTILQASQIALQAAHGSDWKKHYNEPKIIRKINALSAKEFNELEKDSFIEIHKHIHKHPDFQYPLTFMDFRDPANGQLWQRYYRFNAPELEQLWSAYYRYKYIDQNELEGLNIALRNFRKAIAQEKDKKRLAKPT